MIFCVIVLDEMSITPSDNYDPSTGGRIGQVTLPGHSGIATHGLVFMLAGIAHRWKQTVAYYLTPDSVDGTCFKPIIVEIIKRAEEIGFYVHGVISDMGGANRAMWKAFGIHAGRYSIPVNFCEHPLNSNRKLFFFHDTPHALKNFKEGLLNNACIIIPEKFVQKYNLPTNMVRSEHFSKLLSEQENLQLKLAPKLKGVLLQKNRHFQKMRVSSASNVLSHDVSSALELLADEMNCPELKATSWLVEMIAKWFQIMTNRKMNLAVGNLRPEKYVAAVDFLNEIVECFSSLKIGTKGDWKPFQTGVIVSTLSAIQITDYLIQDRGFQFVTLGRFTQDCVENLFGVVGSKNSTVNALQFKTHLKSITVSQYMKPITTGNYSEDDREYLPDFLTILRDRENTKRTKNSSTALYADIILPENVESHININNLELCSLYNVAGYIISSILKSQACCEKCIVSTGSKSETPIPFSKLTSIKCFRQDTLFFVNEGTFEFFVSMEKIFRA